MKTVVWHGEEHRIAEWRLGDDALIQCVWWPGEPYESTEFISGAEADRCILNDIGEIGGDIVRLIEDERGVYGYEWAEGQVVEFWDCDEESYAEYMEREGE